MEVFLILKIIAQVFGVFPFKRGKTFYFSKLYVVANIVIGIYLVSLTGFFLLKLRETSKPQLKPRETRQDSVYSAVDILMKTVVFGQLAGSLTAVTTKFMWRGKYVEILNSIWDFFRKHNINCILNRPTMFDNVFIAVFSFAIFNEIMSPIIDDLGTNKHEFEQLYSVGIEFPMITDEVMFCVVCSALAKYQREIKRMILRDTWNGEIGKITKDSHHQNILPGDFRQTQLQLFNIIERPMIKRSPSSRAKNLERFRKMNLQILNIHSSYSALHELQLFISISVLMLEHCVSIFTTFGLLTQNLVFDSKDVQLQITKTLIYFTSRLIRAFMMCHYNDKAFNEGVSIKYELQEIRRTSTDKDVIKVSKIFMEQLHTRKQYQICGLFSFNMTLPATFIGYAVNYGVVLVQYLGLRV